MNGKKIGIIANSLNDEKTGIGQYLFNLLRCILDIDKENEYFLINYKDNSCRLCSSNLKVKKIDNFFKPYIGPHGWHLSLPYRLKKDNFDLIFNPSQIPTFFRFSSPYIINICDLIPLLFPELCWGKSRKLFYQCLLPKTLKNASKITTLSHHTKKDLMKYFNISEDKIMTIHIAVDSNKYKPLAKEKISEVRQKYNINLPFILYVGTLEPRKNIVRLIESFYKVRKNGNEHKLVITGKKGWKYKNIFETVRRLNLSDEIIFTDYVPDKDLPALYNAADLFVYPSIYEGFGLPPLEAMACGTSVITSNTSSFPEVVGSAGIMVNPYDVDELAEKISEVIGSDKLKEELSRKGLEQAKMFSWEKCARETLEVFKEGINCKK